MNYENLISQLNGTDEEQLNLYLSDDELLDVLVKNLDFFNVMNTEKEDLHQANQALAKSNLSKESIVNDIKMQLTNEINELENVRNEYLTLVTNYSKDNSDMSLEVVYTILQTMATKAEEETNRLAEDFFIHETKQYNEDELNQFQNIFLEQRMEAYLKKIKADKMKELLTRYFVIDCLVAS